MKMNRILFLLTVLIAVSGCDFFRKMAGRSTSADIKAKKAEIAKLNDVKNVSDTVPVEETVVLEVADTVGSEVLEPAVPEVVPSVETVLDEQAQADSLAAVATLAKLKIKMYRYTNYKGASSQELSHRYYIMVGAFGDAANAEKHIAKIQKNPAMEPVKMNFRTGLVAVGVCPRNKLSDIAEIAENVLIQAFCPMDAWVLVNE